MTNHEQSGTKSVSQTKIGPIRMHLKTHLLVTIKTPKALYVGEGTFAIRLLQVVCETYFSKVSWECILPISVSEEPIGGPAAPPKTILSAREHLQKELFSKTCTVRESFCLSNSVERIVIGGRSSSCVTARVNAIVVAVLIRRINSFAKETQNTSKQRPRDLSESK